MPVGTILSLSTRERYWTILVEVLAVARDMRRQACLWLEVWEAPPCFEYADDEESEVDGDVDCWWCWWKMESHRQHSAA